MNRTPLDGEADAVQLSLAPADCDLETAQRAFAIVTGAAGCLAARLGDEMEFGERISDQEREEWKTLCSFLMALADRNTFGSDYQAGEMIARGREMLEALMEEIR